MQSNSIVDQYLFAVGWTDQAAVDYLHGSKTLTNQMPAVGFELAIFWLRYLLLSHVLHLPLLCYFMPLTLMIYNHFIGDEIFKYK